MILVQLVQRTDVPATKFGNASKKVLILQMKKLKFSRAIRELSLSKFNDYKLDNKKINLKQKIIKLNLIKKLNIKYLIKDQLFVFQLNFQGI